jgi:hypothetical protein
MCNLGSVGYGLVFVRVFCAIVRCELFVSTRLKVPLHLLVILARRRVGRVEDPCTLRTTPTANVRLVYPHHLAHGWKFGIMLCSGGHVVYDTEHIALSV